MKKRTRALAAVVVLAAVLLAARAYLPNWLEQYLEARIDALDGYSGDIRDIDLQLWRGHYAIEKLVIRADDGLDEEPFLAAERIAISVQWRALLQGAIVAEADVYDFVFNFARSQTGASPEGDDPGWGRVVDALAPLELNRLELHGGRIAYLDRNADPAIELFVDDLRAKLTNLRNVTEADDPLPSELKLSGRSIGEGRLRFGGRMNLLREVPDFDLVLELEDAALPAVNDFAREFAAIDFEDGTLGLYTELAAADGYMEGYVKLLARDVEVLRLDEVDNPLELLWETLAAVVMELFENQPRDQFALRIPFSGELDDPETDLWSTLVSIVSNAFSEAFTRNPDGTIDFGDVLEGAEEN